MDLDWQRNLSNTDRVIRAVLAVLLLGLVLTKTLTGWWAAAAAVFSLFQFLEAAAGY